MLADIAAHVLLLLLCVTDALVMLLQTELKYWESYVSEEGFIAGPDFSLAGGPTILIALLKPSPALRSSPDVSLALDTFIQLPYISCSHIACMAQRHTPSGGCARLR